MFGKMKKKMIDKNKELDKYIKLNKIDEFDSDTLIT